MAEVDPWLTIVGIGEDGPAGLSAASRDAIAQAGECQVDLAGQEVRWPGGSESFEIEQETKHRLLNGLDDIGLTLGQEDAIAAFEDARERSGWAGPDTTAL